MHPVLAAVVSLTPYHLVCWGTLLGMQLHQSFIMTKLCYRHLPRSHFTVLQSKVFPVYFFLQNGLVLLTILTYPPASIFSIARSRALWSVHLPLMLSLAVAVLNVSVYGRRTRDVMLARAKIYDSSKANEQENKAELHRLNREFSKNHAMSIHLNAIGMIATVIYGFRLASNMKFVA